MATKKRLKKHCIKCFKKQSVVVVEQNAKSLHKNYTSGSTVDKAGHPVVFYRRERESPYRMICMQCGHAFGFITRDEASLYLPKKNVKKPVNKTPTFPGFFP